METIEMMAVFEGVRSWIRSINLHAIIVGVVCLWRFLIVMPMITEKIPGSLVAVIAGILMVKNSCRYT